MWTIYSFMRALDFGVCFLVCLSGVFVGVCVQDFLCVFCGAWTMVNFVGLLFGLVNASFVVCRLVGLTCLIGCVCLVYFVYFIVYSLYTMNAFDIEI